MTRLVLGAGLIALSLSAAGTENNSKPSPIRLKRSEAHAAALAAAPLPGERTPVTVNEPKANEPAVAGATADTGTACFFRPKRPLPGEPEEPQGLTASHPSFSVGTRVRVTNLGNGKSVVVTITERSNGTDRIICLSQMAAEQLGFVRMGTAQVHLERLP